MTAQKSCATFRTVCQRWTFFSVMHAKEGQVYPTHFHDAIALQTSVLPSPPNHLRPFFILCTPNRTKSITENGSTSECAPA
jgi:hypothetical protein